MNCIKMWLHSDLVYSHLNSLSWFVELAQHYLTN